MTRALLTALKAFLASAAFAGVPMVRGGNQIVLEHQTIRYADGRAYAAWSLPANERGIVLKHGDALHGCGTLGAGYPWFAKPLRSYTKGIRYADLP